MIEIPSERLAGCNKRVIVSFLSTEAAEQLATYIQIATTHAQNAKVKKSPQNARFRVSSLSFFIFISHLNQMA